MIKTDAKLDVVLTANETTDLNIILKIQKAINSKNAIRDKFQLGDIEFADYADAISIDQPIQSITDYYKCVAVGAISYNIQISDSNFDEINRVFTFSHWNDNTTLKSRIWVTAFDMYASSPHIRNINNLWYIFNFSEGDLDSGALNEYFYKQKDTGIYYDDPTNPEIEWEAGNIPINGDIQLPKLSIAVADQIASLAVSGFVDELAMFNGTYTQVDNSATGLNRRWQLMDNGTVLATIYYNTNSERMDI